MPGRRLEQLIKRALDLGVAASGLALTAPAMLGVALLVRARLGSPVLFRQPRPGLGGKPFLLLKFRTMRELRPGEAMVATDSARLTPLGRALRASSLDELPTLWNVLRGDMSLVGPRPLLLQYLERYTERQSRRHEVKPGITGWAVVNGRNAISWDQKLELDVWYVEHWSLALDLRILLQTVSSVVSRKGVGHGNHATTMPEFQGSRGNGGGATG
jgi:sugar transferase EpsL